MACLSLCNCIDSTLRILLETVSRLSAESSLIPQPLPVLLDATDLFAVVIRHWVLHRLSRGIHPVSLDVFVKVVILLRDLLGIASMEQTPHGASHRRTHEPSETGAGECETGIDVDGIETGDGVGGIEFEGEEVGAGSSSGKEGGGYGGDHSG